VTIILEKRVTVKEPCARLCIGFGRAQGHPQRPVQRRVCAVPWSAQRVFASQTVLSTMFCTSCGQSISDGLS